MDKICTKCGQSKSLNAFSRSKDTSEDRTYACKDCVNAYSRAHYRKDVRKALLMSARVNARPRGLSCTLTLDDIPDLPSHCPVLGIKLSVADKGRNDHSASLDRIDNTRGYDKDNIVIVSWRANRLKGSATCEELRMIADFYERNKNE